MKGSIHHEDIIILNIYEPNNKASKHMKQNAHKLARRNRQIHITVKGLMPPLKN